jgi:hypothetical protein
MVSGIVIKYKSFTIEISAIVIALLIAAAKFF